MSNDYSEVILVDSNNLIDISDIPLSHANNNALDISDIKNINKYCLYKKLESVEKNENCYKANELINILSINKERDKKLIGNYNKNEVVIKKTNCYGYNRNTRFLTQKGIARYLHEGKIFSYENACKYFNVKPKDLDVEKWNLQLEKLKTDDEKDMNKYKTNLLLKWLFEKRKSCKNLGTVVSIESLLEWISNSKLEDEISNKKKIKYLKNITTIS